MISIPILKHLVKHKIKDAESLLNSSRYPGSIYLAGYAVEIALKYRICRTLLFNNGYPENKQELNMYLNVINANNINPLVVGINNLKTHNLSDLLFYSGVELRIKNNFLAEWSVVSSWNPENRYRKIRVTRAKGLDYLKSAKKIIKEIS